MRLLVLGLAVFLALIPATLRAQWQMDGIPICTAPGPGGLGQILPAIASDGSLGGAYIGWSDSRNNSHHFLQHITTTGLATWAQNGIEVAPTNNSQTRARSLLLPEDFHGVYVAFDSFGQYLDAQGIRYWTDSGLPTMPAGKLVSAAVPNENGAIFIWSALTSAELGTDIYGQSTTSGGMLRWGSGVAINADPGDQICTVAVKKYSGDVIAAWQDAITPGKVRAQALDNQSVKLWGSGGVAVCTATSSQQSPLIVRDKSFGAIVVWTDSRDGGGKLYAQRLSTAGVLSWGGDGVPVCTTFGQQLSPAVIEDGAGGVIVSFNAEVPGGGTFLTAQRLDSTGARVWNSGGVTVCDENSLLGSTLASDSYGGAIIVWTDSREPGFDKNIFAQQIDAAGGARWAANGIPVCSASNDQVAPVAVSDRKGGAFVAWQDGRSSEDHIYAQRILPDGEWPTVDVPAGPVRLALETVGRNPSLDGTLNAVFELRSDRSASIGAYDVAGRRVESHDVSSSGPGRHFVTLGEERRLPPGLYLLRLQQGNDAIAARAVILR